MHKLAHVVMRPRRKQGGVTVVEYGVAGALVAAAVIGAFLLLGGNISALLAFLAATIVSD